MMQQDEFVVSQAGCGNVTDGSVDFYEMEWEIVDPGSAEQEDPGCGCGGETPEPPAQRRCIDNQPQQTDDAGGYEIINA